jgi:hypothetical protein
MILVLATSRGVVTAPAMPPAADPHAAASTDVHGLSCIPATVLCGTQATQRCAQCRAGANTRGRFIIESQQ